jgi:hypothetical protein
MQGDLENIGYMKNTMLTAESVIDSICQKGGE